MVEFYDDGKKGRKNDWKGLMSEHGEMEKERKAAL